MLSPQPIPIRTLSTSGLSARPILRPRDALIRVVVFFDITGNRWDLPGPAAG
jgi:hypothetical protein